MKAELIITNSFPMIVRDNIWLITSILLFIGLFFMIISRNEIIKKYEYYKELYERETLENYGLRMDIDITKKDLEK